MVITITASTSSSSLSITAPTTGTLRDYLGSFPKGVAVSIPTTGTGTSLTAIGKTLPAATDSVWRIRNGNSTPLDATLSSYGGGFSAEFVGLPSGTDTFVVSSVWTTHRLQVGSTAYVKAAGTQVVSSIYTFKGTEEYSLNGGSGDDTLTGAGFDDILKGNGGNDTLTGGAGSDRFVFTNQGTDTITDFSATDNDVFAITSSFYLGSPNASTTPVVSDISSLDNTNIIVDTIENIQTVTGASARFAYATNTNQLLYDGDGDWTNSNTVVIANAPVTGTLSASNFAFV